MNEGFKVGFEFGVALSAEAIKTVLRRKIAIGAMPEKEAEALLTSVSDEACRLAVDALNEISSASTEGEAPAA